MIKRAAILIHGFNVGDGGRSTVGTLAPFFAGQGVVPIVINYGYFGLLQTKFRNEAIAKRVFAAVAAAYKSFDEVYVVGHSNGCAITHLASLLEGFKAHGFVYINPALRSDYCRGPGVSFIHVWYSPSDRAVKFARWLPFRGAWGEMGAKGYSGVKDTAIVNFDKENDFALKSKRHSDVFDISKRPYFGPLIVRAMLAHSDPTV